MTPKKAKFAIGSLLIVGAIGYLMAPVWFALLVIWALIGRGEEASVLTYFSETNPLMPSWPDMSGSIKSSMMTS